jgi:hypothetical protein
MAKQFDHPAHRALHVPRFLIPEAMCAVSPIRCARLERWDSILRCVVEENAGPSSAQKQDQDQNDKETGIKENPEVPAQDTTLLCHS